MPADNIQNAILFNVSRNSCHKIKRTVARCIPVVYYYYVRSHSYGYVQQILLLRKGCRINERSFADCIGCRQGFV